MGDPRGVLSAGPTGRSTVPLLVAPLLVVAAIALLKISNELLSIGPFDRAQFGWLIPIPMLLLAPAVAGLAARATGERRAMAALIALSAALGGFVTVLIASSTRQIGCTPIEGAWGALVPAAFIGFTGGLGFAAAGIVALRLRERPLVALLGSAATAVIAGALTLIVFGAVFAAGTCVPLPTPG